MTRLKDFFLTEAGQAGTFKDPRQLGNAQQQQAAPAGQVQQPAQGIETQRFQTLPTAVQGYVREIEKMCQKLNDNREGDPDLKALVHKFLLDLNKWLGEEPPLQ